MRTLAVAAALALASIACSGGEPTRSSSREPSARAEVTPAAPGRETTTAEDDEGATARSAPTVVLEPPGQDAVTVRAEVARTPAQTQHGLMYRRDLEADAGMLFLFPRPRHITFWMRNTYLPLDMIFITSDMRVLGVVENATPETDDVREVDGISQYVLEVNAGFARAHGVGPGTAVRFENIAVPPVSARAADEDEDDEGWED